MTFTPYPAEQYPGQAGAGAGGWPTPARSKTVGLVALIVAIVVVILSPIASAFIGAGIGPHVDASAGFAGNFQESANSTDPAVVVLGGFIVLQFVLGSAFGTWGLVQGIIAAATKRGRAYGVVAIVLAALAPLLSLIVFGVASSLNS